MNIPVRLLTILLAALVLAACSQSAYEGIAESSRHEVMIFAAASLKDAFNDIGKIVEKEDSTVRIVFNFGASNVLARQIEQGAPVDVFASAASNVMDSLDTKGAILHDTRVTFAHNSLVVIGPKGSAPIASLDELASSRFKRLTVAAPGVPARTYSEEALRKAGVWEKLTGRFVYGENVRQVVDYVATSEAEAGVVYATDAAQFKGRVVVMMTIPAELHRPIVYPIAVVKNGRNRVGADVFIRVLSGPKGTEILRRYGFPVAGK